MMKVLVIGASGMVGHILMQKLYDENIDVIGIGRRKINRDIISIDLNDWNKFKQFLRENKFDIIFNCSGILINESNANKLQAVYINSLFPHLLADVYKNVSTKIVHLSTGGVFSGNDEAYFEDDAISPPTFYGATKAAGEFCNDKDLIVRSDFWGPDNKKEGSGLFNWFLRQKNEIRAFENVWFNGISSIEFSNIALEIIKYNGILNVGVNELISKAEFLRKIKNTFKLINITLVSDTVLHKKVYLKTKTEIPKINNYDKMIEDIYHYMIANKQLYINIYPDFYSDFH